MGVNRMFTYQKAIIKDNKIEVIESKKIDQKRLTSDCWLIQFEGLKACEHCEGHGTKECGGGVTLQSLLKRK